ncbi:MAG: hypothetical protein AAGK67_02290 [Pseudomonadota bacterium]
MNTFKSSRFSSHLSNIWRWIAFASVGLAAIIAAAPAFAHVRWFIDNENPQASSFVPYTLTDTAVLVWIALVALMLFASVVLDRVLPGLPIANSKIRHDVMELMRIFTGMSLLLTAYEGALVAPHLVAFGGFGLTLVFLQVAIGLLLISNNFVYQASLLLILLYAGMIAKFGFVRSLEYVNTIGIALFLLFNYIPSDEWRERLKPYSVDMLRIFTGIALVTLGVSEKLGGAIYGHAFIANYDWNFMQMLGFDWFTDRLLVLSTGAMEVVFGLILIMGTITRLTTLVISILMFTSNVVFLITGNNDEALVEVIGHMPIISTALILLLLGYGQRLKITRWPGTPSGTTPMAQSA